jgi:hypothetical protein
VTLPDPSDTTQPKPLRLIAAVGAVVTLVVGGLPAFGAALTATQIGVIVGIVGALSTVAVVFVGEPKVTPVASPKDNRGRKLVPREVTGDASSF